MKQLFFLIGFFVVISPIFYYLPDVIAKAERAECLQLRQQASMFPKFYLTEYQMQQCAYHNITIK